MAIVLTSCGSDSGDGQVKLAEARVTAKEKALAEAKSAADAASTAFCDASQTYIVALDRYGDVLNATAPTVGDVRDAGADLAEPRQAAIENADAAVAAQQQLFSAEQELAEAQTALAPATSGSGQQSATDTATTTTSATPAVPSDSANRVKQADSDFTAAQKAITDKTPLAQASQQFNAAAVALEMSWLRLFADAGCLTDEQQKRAEAAVRDYTVALQESLAAAGYYDGKIDGVYGPATLDAVEALQKANGLPVTGTVDKATDAALQADLHAKGGEAAQQALASTAAVQQTLKLAGFWDGPVDGEWTPALTDALMSFQTELGVKPTGTVDAATIAAFEEAIASARKPAPSPSTPSAPPSPSATSSRSSTASPA
ncbi:MAG: peptidoglycan-binding domain-containing protein [Actinomycetes bacterium]